MKNIIITGTKGKTTLVSLLDYLFRVNLGERTILINSLGLYVNGELKRDNEYYMKNYKLSPNVTAYNEVRGVISSSGEKPDYLIGEGSYSLDSRIKDTLLQGNIDVGVITNVYHDHIDGAHIKNQRDLLKAKLFVARNLREGGTLILNISNFPQNILHEALDSNDLNGKQCILISTKQYPQLKGRIDYFLDENGNIFHNQKSIGHVREYPITFGGFHSAMNENLLTLIAICDTLGFDYQTLKTITNLNEITPGRLNVFKGKGKTVLLDFAHEEESIRTTVSFLKKYYPGKKVTGIIRLSYYRDNEYIVQVSRQIAPLFDKVYIYDKAVTNLELREIYLAKLGKKLGEVGELMYQTISKIQPETSYIEDEYDAIETGIREMTEDEILFIIGGDNLKKSAQLITDSLK